MDSNDILILNEAHVAPVQMALPLFWGPEKGVSRISSERMVLGCDLLVFVWSPCRKQMLEHARSQPRHEIGGFLLGRYGDDGQQRFVVVEQALPVPDTGSMIEFRFSADAVQILDAQHQAQYPDLLRVGWYHSHPLGMRLSGVDLAAHERIFRRSHHIAIVMTTGGFEIGCAVWHRGKVSLVGGFFVLEGEVV